MLTPNLYQHIIWDWNGTLLDDTWLFVDIMNNILMNKNMESITLEKYKEIFDFPVKNYYAKLGFKVDKKSFEKYGMEFINIYKKRRYEAKVHNLVDKILAELTNKNIKHSILSAQHQLLLNDLINYYNLNNHFQNIIGLNNYYANSKIKEGKQLIKKINLNPSNILLIGDTNHDYEVAQKLKIDCLLISHGHHSHSKLLKTKATVIKEIFDIFKIFKI